MILHVPRAVTAPRALSRVGARMEESATPRRANARANLLSLVSTLFTHRTSAQMWTKKVDYRLPNFTEI